MFFRERPAHSTSLINGVDHLTARGAMYISETMHKLAFLAVVVFLCGCGRGAGSGVHLSGTVTIDGKPIPSDATASMSFKPTQGGESAAVPIVDGRYDSPKTPQGRVSVHFSVSRPVGHEKVSERTGEKYREIANLVPPEHSAGMLIEVQDDNSNQNFDL